MTRVRRSVVHDELAIERALTEVCPHCACLVGHPCRTILTREPLRGVHAQRVDAAGFRDWIA